MTAPRFPFWMRLLSRSPRRELRHLRVEHAACRPNYLVLVDLLGKMTAERDALVASIAANVEAHESARAQWESDLRKAAVGAHRFDQEIERLSGELDAARVAIGELRGVLARLTADNPSWLDFVLAKEAGRQLLSRPGADLGLPA